MSYNNQMNDMYCDDMTREPFSYYDITSFPYPSPNYMPTSNCGDDRGSRGTAVTSFAAGAIVGGILTYLLSTYMDK